MDSDTSALADVEIGQVFTPLPWAEWLIEKWGVFDAWRDGASVCEPTAGRGAFALALFHIARNKGVDITPQMLARLSLVDIRRANLDFFREKAARDYGIDFPWSRLMVKDVITEALPGEYDMLVGNPPWSNFTDLPPRYKMRIKPHFIAEGLVPDTKKVLLGSSRVDLAALILEVVLGKMLRARGVGCFYLPLSLFSGDDAHRGFRDYRANGRNFFVDEVHEFTTTEVFEGIGTSYCCARFRMDLAQRFPVKYFRELDGSWVEHSAMPLLKDDDQWRVLDVNDAKNLSAPIKIELSPKQKPRQGVNSCGANAVFVFDEKPAHLPQEFLFPLATKELWRRTVSGPTRWILLPYDRDTGKPLSWNRIEGIEALRDYLLAWKDVLSKRKGTLIQSAMNRGYWWSLLGVGPYSFTPYKVIWEAYGKTDFKPIIVGAQEGKEWQANQALHAFIPCWREKEARRIKRDLEHPAILTLLKQLNGGGKCNWAQPGKIKKVLAFDRIHFHQTSLFE
jgi:hypothetical protein